MSKLSGLGGMIQRKLYGSAKSVANIAKDVGSDVADGAKTLTSKKDYLSTSGPNQGNTYTRYGGLVSVLKKGATAASKEEAYKKRKTAEMYGVKP